MLPSTQYRDYFFFPSHSRTGRSVLTPSMRTSLWGARLPARKARRGRAGGAVPPNTPVWKTSTCRALQHGGGSGEGSRGAWLAPSEEQGTLDLGDLSARPTLGGEKTA